MADTASVRPAGLRDPDAFYEALLTRHESLTPDQSQALNARLVLLLAQALGDDAKAHALLAAAAADLGPRPGG